MVRSKYIYWCTRHQQHVATIARRKLKDEHGCEVVKLNLTHLQQLDLHKLSTWISWDITKKWTEQIDSVLDIQTSQLIGTESSDGRERHRL